ncbi:MAG: hypothetical protein JO333_00675 [Verrucomicrobia bacterium]|nr:hypothetical protein [Verrucomicrobiota bacterium]
MTSEKIRSYQELKELIRISLRAQHPEWVEPSGESPICNFYEARLAELLGLDSAEEEGSGKQASFLSYK